MLTFNKINAKAYDMVGSPQDGGMTTTNITQDINDALHLFKNAARRYWTRKEITASLVASQQDYQLPADFVRATQVKIITNGISYPLTEITSEKEWNELNIITSVTVYIPKYYFVKGFNVISLWPAPATTVAGTLDVSYEPRLPDYSLADVTGTATVTNAAVLVTDSATSYTQSMVNMWFSITDGSDGNWYQIGAVPSSSTLNLANFYQGVSGGGRPYIIGACPDIPEDYHIALCYYAAWQFYLKRKDVANANQFFGYFDGLLQQYKKTYANKTTGVVQTKQRGKTFSVFSIPPTGIS